MEKEQDSRSLLGDLSFTQIVAGAAASAVSFALAKQTGILGSVIGAAVGSIAATIAGAVFTNMIDRSVEGIRGAETVGSRMPQPGAAQTARRSLAPVLAALTVAAIAGISAVWIYASGIDFLTEGQGIGTQAPVIEYVLAPQETQDAPADVDGDEAAASEEAPSNVAAEETPDDSGEPSSETDAKTSGDAGSVEMTAPSEADAPASDGTSVPSAIAEG